MEAAGGRQWSQAQADALQAKALRDLAAANPTSSSDMELSPAAGPPRQRIARRSRYAEQLHSGSATSS